MFQPIRASKRVKIDCLVRVEVSQQQKVKPATVGALGAELRGMRGSRGSIAKVLRMRMQRAKVYDMVDLFAPSNREGDASVIYWFFYSKSREG